MRFYGSYMTALSVVILELKRQCGLCKISFTGQICTNISPTTLKRAKLANDRKAEVDPPGLLRPPNRTMDIYRDLPVNDDGNDAVLVIVDTLTKGAHFVETSTNLSASELALLFLDNY
ncbi:hypothetical protein PHMEG_00035876, partial [Phytophthora megakarya]